MQVGKLLNNKSMCHECERVAMWLIETEKRRFLTLCQLHAVVLKAQINDIDFSNWRKGVKENG